MGIVQHGWGEQMLLITSDAFLKLFSWDFAVSGNEMKLIHSYPTLHYAVSRDTCEVS